MNLEKYLIPATEALQPDFNNPQDLSTWMKSYIHYRNFFKLQSPQDTEKSGFGSCHDQVVFELDKLRKMNGLKNVQAHFFMELNEEQNQGGMTHSFITYQYEGRGPSGIFWFDNAASNWAGINKFRDYNEIKKFIKDEHSKGNWGNPTQYPKVYFGTFSGKVGDSLQNIVDKSLR